MAENDENILNLSPKDFRAAVDELAQSDSERERLYKAYQDKQNMGGDLSSSTTGYRRLNILPMEVPEGKTGGQAIMDGDWKWAVPGLITGTADAATDAVQTPGNLLKGVPYTKEQMQEQATNLAGSMMLGGVSSGGSLVRNPNQTNMFVGRSAEGPKGRLLKDVGEARKQNSLSSDTDVIRDPELSKGFKGVYENPKSGDILAEVDDSSSKITLPKDISKEGTVSTTLGDILQHDKLYEEYPGLKDVKLDFVDPVEMSSRGVGAGTLGFYTPATNTFGLSKSLANAPEKLRSVLLHEVQHQVQKKEGWDGGSNPQYAQSILDELSSVIDEKSRQYLHDRALVRGARNNPWSYPQSDVDLARKESVKFRMKNKELASALDEAGDLIDKGAFHTYQNDPGETMARLVQKRENLPERSRTELKFSPFGEDLQGRFSEPDYANTKNPSDLQGLNNDIYYWQSQRDVPKYAEGGLVMDNLEEALPTMEEATETPPATELPAGAIPEDVADDVHAQVSKGEYIIPANIVRFLGVEKLEGLVAKAQAKLQELEDSGRMGVRNEEKAADQVMPGFATGGLVTNPNRSTQTLSTTPVMAQFKGPSGDTINVQLVNGQPTTPVPAGYTQVQTSTGQGNTALTPNQVAADQVQKNTSQMNTQAATGQASSTLPPLSQGQQADEVKDAPTGTSKALGDWTSKDFNTKSIAENTQSGRIGASFADTFSSMALGPLRSFMGPAIREDRAKKTAAAKAELEHRVSTGLDMNGNPLSAEDLAADRASLDRYSNPEAVNGLESVATAITGSPAKAISDPVGLAVDKAVGYAKDQITSAAKEALSKTETGSKALGLVDRVKDIVDNAKQRAVDSTVGAVSDAVGGLVSRPDTNTTNTTTKDSATAAKDSADATGNEGTSGSSDNSSNGDSSSSNSSSAGDSNEDNR